jgi:hypothetical protein
MTSQEKRLYHQIHPLKLATDISAEIVSLYLFWKHRLLAGMLILFIPPVIVSTLIMRLANLEPYRQSALGRYIREYMTPSAVAVRILGTIITHVGAWFRKPVLIPLGLVTVLLGWLRGKLVPNTRTRIQEKAGL